MSLLSVRIYNTLSGKLEKIIPIKSNKLGIYVCGVTVYDKCHLGHIRGAVNFDVIRKFLEFAGYDVTYVKNFTDIDDKIINRANETGIDWKKLNREMIANHDAAMAMFGVEPPNIAPKATDHVPEMLAVIESLIRKDYAYQSEGDVYFKAAKFDRYGQLSGKIQNELNTAHRIGHSELKQNQYDFALWKNAKPGEPYWESPWGNGRPGWHIECSAMCGKYLGDTFDIHGGGSDLIFPHHENEIAQSFCHSGKMPANYWIHNGMITVDGRKMSKSLGNFITADEYDGRFHPEIIRLYFLKTHYRQILNFTESALIETADNLDRLYNTLTRFENSADIIETCNHSPGQYEKGAAFENGKFITAMCDDFNTPDALAALFNLSKRLNMTDFDAATSKNELNQYIQYGQILGIFKTAPEQWFGNRRINAGTITETLSLSDIELLIEERNRYRKEKNWMKADEIRDQLKNNNITIMDKGEKTVWQYS